MKKISIVFLSVLFTNLVSAQELNNKVLFTVEQDTVTAEEYIAVYNKNRNLGEDIDPKTAREYLDLYQNFKLKVHEAKALGMDTTKSFKREYYSYRNQLAKPYLSDRDVTEELIKEAYDRMKYDVRASHIMLSAPDDAEDMDKEKALAKIKTLKKRIENGEKFEDVAKEYSADSYSAVKGGDLGYFTVFGMVYPFESAAYNLELGEISEPIKTRFGYHIVKKTDQRPARGTIVTAHIMLVDNDKSTEEQKAAAKRKIFEIYEQLKGGEAFEDLVKRYSEDKSTVQRGGNLQPFGINKMFPQFEEAAFALKNVGDYTEPVKTPIGWHIIKLVEGHKLDAFDQKKREIKNRVERDQRSQQSKQSIVKRLKKEYSFKENPKNKRLAFKEVDDSYLQMNYSDSKAKFKDKDLFAFANQKFVVGDFLTYLVNTQSKGQKGGSLRKELEKAYDAFTQAKLIAYEKTQLESKYPEFKMLSREYYEGILLFDLTEKRVWKKSVTDSVGLERYYEANKNKFLWDTRYRAILVDAASSKLAKKARKMLKKGKSIEEIEAKLNKDSELNVKLESGLFETKEKDLLKENDLEVGLSDIVEKNERFYLAQVNEIMQPSPKTLEEARGLIISEFQNYLEQEWINDLKTQYKINLNKEVLEEVIEVLEVEG
jgi:peptidyl-prolyl cis-trans isomerase SurA